MQTVNLLQLAAANGQLATLDPTVSRAPRRHHGVDRRAARSPPSTPTSSASRSTCRSQSKRRFPTVRIDYNITDKHRFSSAWNYNWFTDYPDTLNNRDACFPGFPVEAGQSSVRWSWSQQRPVDAVAEHRQRGARRLQQRAGHVLQGDERRHVRRDRSPTRAASSSNFPTLDGTGLTAAEQSAGAAVAQRHGAAHRGHAELAEGIAQHQHGRFLDAVPTVGEELQSGADASTSASSRAIRRRACSPARSARRRSPARRPRTSPPPRTSTRSSPAASAGSTATRGWTRTRTSTATWARACSARRCARPGSISPTRGAGSRTSRSTSACATSCSIPFYPLNSSYSTATLADLCGVSGVGSGDEPRNEVQPVPAGHHARQAAAVRQLREGRVRVRRRLQQLRAERRLRVEPERQAGLARHAARRAKRSSAAATRAPSTGTA